MKTVKAAVIGHPIGHTMSPFLQKKLFNLQNIPMEYSVLDIPDLAKEINVLKNFDFFNITIPYKSDIIPYLDGIDEKARVCGSVNSVKVVDGKMYGTTTDGAGCYKSLQNHGVDFSGNLLLLGNGGAARAIAFEVAQRQKGFYLTIACRESSLEKADSLAADLKSFAESHEDKDFQLNVMTYGELEKGREKYDLLMNTTSVGMFNKSNDSVVSDVVISRCNAVFDAVYNPEVTELIRIAKNCGLKTVIGGMEMLVYQGVAAHEFWYGAEFDDKDINELCGQMNVEMKRVFYGE